MKCQTETKDVYYYKQPSFVSGFLIFLVISNGFLLVAEHYFWSREGDSIPALNMSCIGYALHCRWVRTSVNPFILKLFREIRPNSPFVMFH